MPERSLDSVGIDGFRGLRNLQLHGLGLLNILVGENNSGKTSVLEAISILCKPYDPSEWLAMVRRRDFGGLDETRIQSLRWCFAQTGELTDPDFMFQSQCSMTCSGAFPLRKLTVEYKDIVGKRTSKELDRRARRQDIGEAAVDMDERLHGGKIVQQVESSIPGSGTHSTEPVFLRFWEEQRFASYRPFRDKINLPSETLTPYSYQLNRLQVKTHSLLLFPSEADPTRGREHVLGLIQQFDPDVLDIEIASFRGTRPAIYLNHQQFGPAPLSVFGDGLRRAVLLASTLHLLKGGGVLLIDEIETGIHVSALGRVFTWLAKAAREFNVQVVTTTHSLEAVDAIALSMADEIDDLVTFHLDQTEHETRAKRIPGDVLLRLRRERGLDVR